MQAGVIYVAYGGNAIAQAQNSIDSLRRYCDWPIGIISAEPITTGRDICHLTFADDSFGARWAKLNQDKLSPFDYTVYLDADTRPRASLQPIVDILADGWDLVLTPSYQQGYDRILWHCDELDRDTTKHLYGCGEIVQLQGGVFGWRRSQKAHEFFDQWRAEWLFTMKQDQGALLRALTQVEMRVWLLGHDWNGGHLIGHHFGSAR